MSEGTTASEPRSKEAVNDPTDAGWSLSLGASLIALAGIGFVLNGGAMLYRVFYSDGFEAGVDSLGGVTRADLAATHPEVLHYIDHLHVNVAGLMVAGGFAVIALAWFGVRRGQRWVLGTAIGLPGVFLAHSLPIHGAAGFSFDSVSHLGPGLLWLPALIVGAVLAWRGLRSFDRQPDRAEARQG